MRLTRAEPPPLASEWGPGRLARCFLAVNVFVVDGVGAGPDTRPGEAGRQRFPGASCCRA
jgi:hypothetical protein